MFDCIDSIYNELSIPLDNLAMRPMVRAMQKDKQFYNKKLIGAEIGVGYGIHAVRILKNLSIECLYLIDPFTSYTGYSLTEKHIKELYVSAVRKLQRHDCKVKWMREFSWDIADKIPDDLSFVYIDANHSYDYVLKDLRLYYPKVKMGGYFGGHDIDATGVVRAVVNFFDEVGRRDFCIVRHDWWIKK